MTWVDVGAVAKEGSLARAPKSRRCPAGGGIVTTCDAADGETYVYKPEGSSWTDTTSVHTRASISKRRASSSRACATTRLIKAVGQEGEGQEHPCLLERPFAS